MFPPLPPEDLARRTISHYENRPDVFWEKTKDHDVSENYAHLFRSITHLKPWKILDFGCGPGRDLKYFSACGHTPVGVEGCLAFCEMARSYAGCDVLHQDFLKLDLKAGYFHGVFANASLFHVPRGEFPMVLKDLHACLMSGGVLFSSNPRGAGEDFESSRYANFMELESYRSIVEAAGFELLEHYYRPSGVPVDEAPWLACVFRKIG